MMNILWIDAVVYLLCCHKISWQLRKSIYWKSYIEHYHYEAGKKTIDELQRINIVWATIYQLISCYFCTGFWLGAIYFLAKIVPHSPLSIWILWWHCVRFSLVTAITSLVVCKIGSHE